jgi:Predicted membrane protein (DUF2142)
VAHRIQARIPTFWRAWVITFVCFVVVGTAWSVAQPIFAGADEAQHAAQSEAVWSGQFLPSLTLKATSQIESGVEHVPLFAQGESCYDVNHAISAKCDTTSLQGTARAGTFDNYVSREPPLPALLTGLPFFLAPDRTGFYLSRLLTSVLGAALLATAVALACSRRRPVLLAGVLVAATPSFIAEFGVLGSSQLEIGSALVLWVAVTLVVTDEPVTTGLAAIMTGSTVLLLLARPASIIYAALAFLVLLACAGRTRLRRLSALKAFWPMVAVVTLVLLFALWWLVFAEAPANPNYLKDNDLPHIAGWLNQLSFSLGYTWDFWAQMIGAIGTNEYSGPAWLAVVWTMLAGGFVLPAVVLTSRRRATALAGVLVALLVLPVAAQAYYAPTVSLTWMGRYDTPIFVGLVVFAAGTIESRLASSEVKRLLLLGIATIGLLQVLEFASTLRRYAVGTSGPLSPLSWAHGWRPPQLAPFPLLCVGSGVILLAYGAMWYLGRMAIDTEPPPPGVPLDTDQKNASATGCAPAGTATPVADPASP